MIIIENVSKSFGNYEALKNISLKISSGSAVGLAGSSGSGKSTLLRCIQGLELPDKGTITCNGRAGFMFQDFQLFPHKTVLENVLYAPRLRDRKAMDQWETIALELLRRLGIEQLKDRYPANLSGGQKQRAALARSLILKPSIMLCDEPTSGLDIATTADVVDLLKSIQNQQTAIIIASHDLDFLAQIADRIILLKNGLIAEDIAPQQLPDPIKYLRKFYGQ
jgi:polar amino acid transport system ATP-binding protein